MKMDERVKFITSELGKLFPDADCELHHGSILDLVVAVVLSAQATDKQVNIITKDLFKKYQKLEDYAYVPLEELEQDIRRIGLYRAKAKNIQAMAREVLENNAGVFPETIEELIKLPGIGRKTANVVVNVGFGHPGFAVDTHVERVSKRLALVREVDNVTVIERKLKQRFPQEMWGTLHHQMIFFGRYKCKARNPECNDCPFQDMCRYYKKVSS